MMMQGSRLPFLIVLLCCPIAGGCGQSQPPGVHAVGSSPNAVAFSARLHDIAAAGRLTDLRWPDFSRRRSDFERVYASSSFGPVWLDKGQPTQQSLAFIQAFEASRQKGLIPEDYDASRWQGRIAALRGSADADTQARFDAALTICAMRYISDLHIGRVDPKQFKFGIEINHKMRDLPEFIAHDVVHASDIRAILQDVEPPYDGYRRTEIALQHYLQLTAKGDGPLIPDVQKSIVPGGAYPGSPQLFRRLQLLGDLPENAAADSNSDIYGETLVNGVRHFQERHGLESDGKLGKETIRQLNVPLAARAQQLRDALERWRWLPPSFPQPPIVVNVPEFVLRVFDSDHKIALEMNVVVGKAYRHQTPVFADEMKYVVFRPYWNVPGGILRGEIIPAIAKNRDYIANKNFEVTDYSGNVVASGPIDDAVLTQLRAGKLTVRQKPGPDNSLGLVKFIFPNEHNVYLHSTPAMQLFSRSRRDFSHGCIRVHKPAELAAYLLRNQPPWNLERVQAAMQSGPNNQQVNLQTPVPVLILYDTAVVEKDGSVHFFNDIYGYDKLLETELAKGRPYLN